MDETYWVSCLSEKLTSSSYGEGLETGPRSPLRQSLTRQNQGFNEAKTLHGLEHLCHHHPNSMLAVWLLAALAMTIDRLYRHRYLHRGTHGILAPIDLVRILRARLSLQKEINSS